MSITITKTKGREILEQCGRGIKMITGSLEFKTTYLTNGETLDLRKLLPNSIDFIQLEQVDGYIFEYDRSARKVKVLYPLTAHTHDIKIKDDNDAATKGVPLCVDEDAVALNARLMAESPTNAEMVHESEEITPTAAVEVENGKVLTALTAVKFFALGW